MIAGEQLGTRGPARTFSPVELFTLELAAGAELAQDGRMGHLAPE